MKLTAYGKKEIILSVAILDTAGMAFIAAGILYYPPLAAGAIVPLLLLVWVLAFFRDPERAVPEDDRLLVSSADGVVTHIEEVHEPDFIDGRALRISVFMSIFSVHLTRAPFPGKVAYRNYHQGEFINAMHADAGHLNEHSDTGFETGDKRLPKILVRQIAGLIARRIVTDVETGKEYARGERIGMIKFGSRTDIFVPVDCRLRVRVTIGEPVNAGSTIIGELPE